MIRYLREQAPGPLGPKQLQRALGVSDRDYPAFETLLHRLLDQGKLYRQRRGRLGAPKDLNLAIGRLQVIGSGNAFVIPDDENEPDIFVRLHDRRGGVDGDRVVARIERRPPDKGPQGRVIEVRERAHSRVVGVFRARKGYARVEAHEPPLDVEFYVPENAAGGANDGDLVVIEVTEWAERTPVARVERVLGRPGDPGVEVLAIQVGYGLPESFPPDIEEAAERIAARGIGAADLEGREDLRKQLVVTIDPPDARDHDDAISIRRLDGGEAWIGVHIADVSHYVTEDDTIDEEAWERGTSVYLVDRVIPMLPHALSSGLCSLVPDEDRLTLTVFLRVDPSGTVRESRFAKTVIRSRHRLSYDEAQAILDGEAEAPADLAAELKVLLEASRAIRRRRRERGSLDFDLSESRVVLDAAGEPTDVQRVLRLPAHQLIEDLMIAANEAVARWAIERAVPILYRIHEPPDEEKLEKLREVAGDFDLSVPTGGVRPLDLQRLLDKARGEPYEELLSMTTLRSMKQARYSPTNEGHFGLASSAYAHFTSPIRRYPDLVVHRQLSRGLSDPGEARSIDAGYLEVTARQASVRERIATEAERDSIELKKIQFMERHVGDTFEATISGVAQFGFFVLLERYHVEGLVHVSTMDDDYYRLDERQHALVGRRRKRKFQLGGRVEVTVVRVDPEERRIDFQLVR
ncbi:MAG: ribonuclease R [Gemmatimonadota bacterium]